MITLSFLAHFFYEDDNCVVVTEQLLHLLGKRVPRNTLRQVLQQHPDYTSLLGIRDTLADFGVNSIGVKISPQELPGMPAPFITGMEVNGEPMFVTVKEITPASVTYLHPLNGRLTAAAMADFMTGWSGVVLLAEPLAQGPEKKTVKAAKKDAGRHIIFNALLFSIACLVLRSVYFIMEGQAGAYAGAVFCLLSLLGALFSLLIIWQSVDQHNPFLGKICRVSKHVDCNAVLQSGSSRLFGVISWGETGFAYFTAIAAMLFINGPGPLVIAVISWLSVVSLPYMAYALFYQWKVVKKWCVLCLAVQGVLAAAAVVALVNGLHWRITVDIPAAMVMAACFLWALALAVGMRMFAERSYKTRRYKREMKRYKFDPVVFDALLKRQQQLRSPGESMGILLGNPLAPNRITQICSPYCAPCAQAHRVIEEMLEDGQDIFVQIIFNVPNRQQDRRSQPVQHFMALYERGDRLLLQEALKEWYGRPSYGDFAGKYPVPGNLAAQGPKLDAMFEWCVSSRIEFTPTIYINGYQLPGTYRVDDMKYLLRS